MEVSGRVKSKPKDGKEKILCQPCQSDGDNVPAEGYCETCNEYFCSSCLKFHRKQSMSKNHVIKDKDEMPRFSLQTDPCSDLCAVHKTEIVKFYCQGHNSVGCGDCMVLDHKTCRVRLVSEVPGNYGNSVELQHIKNKIEDLQKDISASKHEIKKSLKVAEEVKNHILEDIKSFRREMNNYLDDVEKELLQEVEEISANEISQQSQLLDECESMEKEIADFQKNLDSNSDKFSHLFVTIKHAQLKIDECQKSAEEIASKSKINMLKFEPCKEIASLNRNRCALGTIEKHAQMFTAQRKNSKADLKTEYVKKITIKTTEDTNDCEISGLAMIFPDELVLVDFVNDCLKILNVRENVITSKYKTPGKPWDVAVINSRTVATTLIDKGKILFMSTTNGLSGSHSLKVRNNCRGIDHRNSLMAVSFVNPPAVQILNMKGNILHEVKDAYIFGWPQYIAFRDDNHVVVADYYKHAVYELTIDGHLKATMSDKNLKYPAGLVVTSNGTVVVCYESNSDRVSMIAPDTREILPLYVQDVREPRSVLICEDSHKMYIGEHGLCSNRNIVHMYDLK